MFKEDLQKIATANLKDIYPNTQTILKIKSQSKSTSAVKLESIKSIEFKK